MADSSITIYPAKRVYRFIITSSILYIVFLFWLALSTASTVAILIASLAIIWAILTAAIIKKPFALQIDDFGLRMLTPFGDFNYVWDNFESFAIKRADPITKHIVFKLRPGVERLWIFRFFSPINFDGSLFPYFEMENKELLQLLKSYKYKGRVSLIV